jgi:hypothetical protein
MLEVRCRFFLALSGASAGFAACTGLAGLSGEPGGGSVADTGVVTDAFVDSAAFPRDVSLEDATHGGDAALADSDSSNGTCFSAPNDAGTCNDVQPQGGLITSTCSTGPTPTPMGGTIEDGTYVLTSTTYFGNCPGTQVFGISGTICGNTWQFVVTAPSADGGAVETARVNFARVPATGASLNIVYTCYTQQVGGLPTMYTASPGQVIVYGGSAPSLSAETYVKQ